MKPLHTIRNLPAWVRPGQIDAPKRVGVVERGRQVHYALHCMAALALRGETRPTIAALLDHTLHMLQLVKGPRVALSKHLRPRLMDLHESGLIVLHLDDDDTTSSVEITRQGRDVLHRLAGEPSEAEVLAAEAAERAEAERRMVRGTYRPNVYAREPNNPAALRPPVMRAGSEDFRACRSVGF